VAPSEPAASAVMGAGTVTTGAVVSETVTKKLPLLLFPAASAAEHLTVVVPSGNTLPEAIEQVTGRVPSTLSLAEAEYVTTAPDALVASALMLPGSCRTGAAWSFTSMVKVVVLGLLRVSLEEQTTLVWPSGKVAPEAGAQVTVRAPSTASLAVGLV
jgi:hypothetical protein